MNLKRGQCAMSDRVSVREEGDRLPIFSSVIYKIYSAL